MRWEDNAKARFYYRSRDHQHAQLTAAIKHAGPLEGKSVLDVGCGYGDLLRLLPQCDYYGIDTNKHAIKEARRLHPEREFRVTARVRPADVVIAVATLQMVKNPRYSLLKWLSAARERLVVVTCTWEKLTEAVQDEPWWAGIPRETFLFDDDFYTSVVTTKETP